MSDWVGSGVRVAGPRLYSAAEALAFLGLAAADARLTLLLDPVSDGIKLHCRRNFWEASYLEWTSGTGHNWVYVGEYPVQELYRVSSRLEEALLLRYDSVTASHASVRVASDKLVLEVTDVGVTTRTEKLFAGFLTLGLLETEINSVAGWTAKAFKPNLSSVDLAPRGGGYALLHNVGLMAATEDLENYSFDPETGKIMLPGGAIFPRGVANVAVSYKAGYAAIPGALLNASLRVLALVYQATERDPTLVAEAIDNYSWRSQAGIDIIDKSIASILRPWRTPLGRLE